MGGVVGGFLSQAGADVVLVARGEHGRVMTARGLTVRTPEADLVVHPPVVASPAAVAFVGDDVVLLAVKSQDTPAALDGLVDAGAAPATPIVCLQNGVSNEPLAAERFAHVYGVPVMAPTLHLEPGLVEAKAGPVPAILDIGRYPDGSDATAEAIAAAFRSAGIVSEVRPDIMRWKWAKLLMNLGNAIEVVCGPEARLDDLGKAVFREGRAVLDANGIAYASGEENRARRGDILRVSSERTTGGSSWQSVMRGLDVETDYLTGEIVRLGAQVGMATPLNSALLRRAKEVARAGAGPGTCTPAEILAEADVG
ncbi:MAG: 2-dehydropantoate 2-reductase [Acidimicrobiales bacterium]|nr:2-dehydropantoate 2-reductase [Acidimicrobiales bacterium]